MNELLKEFKELIGTYVLYQNKKFRIDNVVCKGGKISVFTSVKTYVMFQTEAEEMLTSLSILDDEPRGELVSINGPLESVLVGYKNNADKITDALMKQLEVLSIETNVSQAQLDKSKAISQLANTLVNVEKVKLGYLDLMNK